MLFIYFIFGVLIIDGMVVCLFLWLSERKGKKGSWFWKSMNRDCGIDIDEYEEALRGDIAEVEEVQSN